MMVRVAADGLNGRLGGMRSPFSITTIAALAMVFAITPSLAEQYGAIAYSPSSGARGYAYDYPSRRQAEQRALQECRANGRGCQIAVWYVGACGAVAAGSNGWGSAWGSSRQAAESRALRQCSQYTNNCSVRTWSCTSR